MDGFQGVVVVLIALAIAVGGYLFGRISVSDDCQNYGASKIERTVIECSIKERAK